MAAFSSCSGEGGPGVAVLLWKMSRHVAIGKVYHGKMGNLIFTVLPRNANVTFPILSEPELLQRVL